MEAGGRVIRDLAQADAAGTKAAVLDLDGADNQHFALIAAPAAARDRIVFAAARDFGFINLDQTGQRAAARTLGHTVPRRETISPKIEQMESVRPNPLAVYKPR